MLTGDKTSHTLINKAFPLLNILECANNAIKVCLVCTDPKSEKGESQHGN